MTIWQSDKVTIAEEELFERIRGRKIAIMMNISALDNSGKFLADRIIDENIADVEFFFCMEHGVRGNFQPGYTDVSNLDIRTGKRIVNLYDYPERIPPADIIKEVDAVIYLSFSGIQVPDGITDSDGFSMRPLITENSLLRYMRAKLSELPCSVIRTARRNGSVLTA